MRKIIHGQSFYSRYYKHTGRKSQIHTNGKNSNIFWGGMSSAHPIFHSERMNAVFEPILLLHFYNGRFFDVRRGKPNHRNRRRAIDMNSRELLYPPHTPLTHSWPPWRRRHHTEIIIRTTPYGRTDHAYIHNVQTHHSGLSIILSYHILYILLRKKIRERLGKGSIYIFIIFKSVWAQANGFI